jgi:hypothetical protein
MDRNSPSNSGSPLAGPSGSSLGGSPIERHIANLKILSRLLSHEMRAQSGPRLNLSREEVGEMQICLDLFIEETMRRRGSTASARSEVEVQTVPARMN